MMRLPLMLAFMLSCVVSFGQISVQKGFTAQQLGNNLAGANINIINPTIVGDTSQYGLFNFNGTGLGLNSGVILSTGDIDDAVGPNSDGGTSTPYGRPGDADLSALAGFNTEDAVVFEFEFEVQGDELEFNFVFLSEEYNEFVNSGFNDVFAFYISGPGITGQENLAVVPGTTTPVTINSINNGSFWQFYNDNDFNNGGPPSPVNIEFDGFTTLMKARRTGLTPCGVYKLSLRIADGSDDRLDSGVLLQENSLVSNSIAVNSATFSADTTALEGCIPATFTFNLGATAQTDLNIPIRLGGTALNGVDYQHIDTVITIPAGQTSSTVIINALADGITEGRETVELYYSPSSCAPEDTVVLYIDDATSITFDALGTNLTCNDDSSGQIAVNIAGGSPPYMVTYIDTMTGQQGSVPASALPITGLYAATYLIRVSDQYGCTADAIVVGGNFDAGQTFLPDGTGVSYTSNINISGFNVGQTLNSINQINSICATMEHSYASDLTIELIAPGGQTIQLKNVGTTGSGVNTCDLGEPIASGPVDNWSTSNTNPGVGYQYCWTNTPTYATMNDMISPAPPGPPPTHTFTTLAGNSYTDYYLPAGSYAPRQSFFGLLGTTLNGNWTLRVTDNFSQDNGYIFNWAMSLQADLPDSIVTLTEPPAPLMSHTTTDPACGASTGSIDFSVNGNHAPFSFLWSNSETTEDIAGLTAGSYTVTVTDTTGCMFDYTVNLSNTGAVSISDVTTHETCDGADDGAIDLTVGAGTFTFAWSNGATTEDLVGLAPGSYTVTVSDGSCLGIESYTINAAQAMVFNASITNENCGDQEGIINLAVQGGAGGFVFNWSNGETDALIDDLQQGTYLVTVTDANSCVKIDSFVVINLVGNCVPACDLDITSFQAANETCADGTGFADITVFTTSGPITYLWSNGATTQDLTGLSAGTYTVTVSDAITCQDTMTFNIVNQANGLNISAMNVTNEYCGNGGGAIDAVVSGGAQPYNYLWSNGATSQDILGLTAGSFTLTVTDGNGCKFVNSGTVVNDAGTFQQTYGNAVDEVCSNGTGSIDIIFAGGQTPYTFNWSNGATTEDISGLSAGTYGCTVVDNGGCTITTPSYVINNNAGGLQFDNVDVDNETCSNGQGDITLTVSGGQVPYNYVWNTGATTSSLTALSAGTFSATVTDNSGCAIYTNTLNLANNSGSLSLDGVQVTDEVCGDGTGAVNITVSGNTGPLTFIWSNSSASEDLSNLNAGNYDCTITDSVGCAVYANATVNNDPGAMNVDNTVVIDENCGQSDGSVSIVISGNAAPTTFLWSNGATTQNISAIQGGNYTVTATDALGCTVAGNANVQNNTGTLNLDNQVIANEVCGNGAGSIDLTVSGGSAPVTYLWSNAATTEDLASLSSGTFTCTITDGLGCSLIAGPYTINNSSGTMTQGTHAVTDEICGNGTGAIDITVNGGNAPLTFLWSNTAVTEDLVGLSAGTYTVTVSDATGCALTFSQTVNNNAGGLGLTAVVTDENCTDGAGAIDVTVSGGAPTYTFLWSNTAITEDLSTLSAGTYTITVTDNNGCQTMATYNVNNNSPNFQLSSSNVTNENCGDGTGSVDITLIGGQPTITYLWSNGATTQDISALNSGVYSITATDANGCVVTNSSSVQNDPGSLVVSNDSIVAETCGDMNGAIYLTVANGTPTYTYLWSNGATTANITGIAAGSYTCVITDAAGCNTNYNGVVPDLGGNFQISSVSIQDDACAQGVGSVTTTVSGGTQPYTYSWTNTSGSPCCAYQLHMYDLNGNGWGGNPAPFVNVYVNGSLYGSFTVPPGQGNTFNSASIPVCTGDSISVEYIEANQNDNNLYILLNSAGDTVFQDGPDPFSGGIAFTGAVNCTLFGQGTNTISNLFTGTYNLTVTDDNGCSATGSYNVGNSSGTINVGLISQTNESCGQADGALDVNGTGAASLDYLWSNGATTEDITGLNAGTYSITATDPSSGCSVTDMWTVTNNSNGLAVTDTTITNETCGNGQGAIDLTVAGGTGPYSYAWSNGGGTEDIILLVGGTYTVTITDASGCDLIETYTVVNNANGLAVTDSITSETCGDGTGAIDISVTGGAIPYTYNWSNGATTEDLTGMSAGAYSCTITDATSCVFVYNGTINNTNSTVSAIATINDAVCNDDDGDVTLTVTGGVNPLSYLWDNGETTQNINNVFPGNYTVSITEANGCMYVDSFVVGNQGFGNVNASDTTIVNETCGNGQGSIDIETGGFGTPDFLWSTGATTEDINNLSAGTYMVTISTPFGPGGGCTNVETYIVLNDQGTLALDSLLHTDETCSSANGTIDIFVSGGSTPYNFVWNNGATSEDLTGLSAGMYMVTVTDANGCTAVSGATNLTNNTFGFGVAGAQVTDENCGDGTGAVDITVTGGTPGYTFVWSNSATTEDLTGLSAGTYTVTVSDNAGCAAIHSYNIINNTNNFNSSAVATDAGCQPTGTLDLTVLGGSPGYTFLWSNGATVEDITGLSAGAYNVTISDALGCTILDTFTVGTLPNNLASSGTVVAANCTAADGSVDFTVSGGAAPFNFVWSNGETTEDLNGVVSGTYDVTVTDNAGCTLTDTYVVGNTGGGLNLNSTPTASTCGLSNGGMCLAVTGGATPYAYLWSNGATTACVSGIMAGNYNVTVSDQNGCALSVPMMIPNIGNPVNLISGDTSSASCSTCSDGAIDLTLGATGAPFTFTWDNGANTEDLPAVLPGTYGVTITSVNGCSLDTSFTVDFTTSIIELEGIALKVYPNPSSGIVFVEFSQDPADEIKVEIFNALGQVVKQRIYAANSIQNLISLDVEDAASGTYMMKISSGAKYTTKRIVILKE